MNARNKLATMSACSTALDWIGNRTSEQAWNECERGDWMCWLLRRIAPNDQRCRLAAADFAERVWRLIPDEPTRLATAWAIDAARRGDEDEMRASAYASADAAYAAYASADAAYAAAYASADAAYAAYAAYAACAACASAYAAYDAAAYASAAYASAAYAERAEQANILRGYFSARDVGDLFRQATA